MLYNRSPMGNAKKKAKAPSATIAQNRKARHEYHLEEHFEAGLVLEGWEAKSLRAGKGNLTEAYVLLKDGEAFLFGARFEPLIAAVPTSTRIRCAHASCCCIAANWDVSLVAYRKRATPAYR